MESLVQAVIAVLAIANPLGAVPVFLSLTTGWTTRARQQAALRAAIAVFLILTVSALSGRWILVAFGISEPAFRAAGGLVILLMGLEMLQGIPTRVQHEQPRAAADPNDDPIVIPLAMPLVAGPGAITTVITLTARSPGPPGQLDVLAAVSVTSVVLFLTLLSSTWLAERITPRGQRIFLRFMGLVLVSVGTQLLLAGVKTFLV